MPCGPERYDENWGDDGFGGHDSETPSSGVSERLEIRGLHLQVSQLTAMLCYLCNRCEASGVAINEPVATWWNKHKELDRRRSEAEAKKAEKARLAQQHQEYLNGLRERLLVQLTPEELESLGVAKPM